MEETPEKTEESLERGDPGGEVEGAAREKDWSLMTGSQPRGKKKGSSARGRAWRGMNRERGG